MRFRLSNSSNSRGLTLVELLTVIAIISLLIQLVLPAVQAARAAARKTQCKNHLHQLSVGSQLHINAQGYLPSGGWSGAYTADPNRGYGRRQPGAGRTVYWRTWEKLRCEMPAKVSR